MRVISQQCVYCGQKPGTTSDHVPPYQMFPDPKPSDLITVPACCECNKGFQKDEDYFRALFGLTGAPIQYHAPEFWSKVSRGVQRSPALKKTIADSLRTGTMVNPDGKEVGSWINVEDNWHRIVSLIAKCVRGLYFFEMGMALSPSVEVECSQHGNGPIALETLYELGHHGKRAWPNVFEYRHRVAADNPEASAWILSFYSTFVYTAFTGEVNIDHLQNNEPEATR